MYSSKLLSQRNSDAATVIVGLFVIAIWLAAAVGWIWNIVKIFAAAGDPITAWFIIRVVGVFAAPVGAVVGYL